jgi:hypothetical protein
MTSKSRITANIGRIVRALLISPVFLPYMLILWALAFLADELTRGGMIGHYVDNQLNKDESLLNAMVRFINWEY